MLKLMLSKIRLQFGLQKVTDKNSAVISIIKRYYLICSDNS